MNWYIGVIKKYAIFNGRARRKEYWMFFLFNLIISFAIGFVTGLLGAILDIGTSISDPASIIYSLAILVPSITVAIRRLHDIGRSGWWILLPIVNLVFLCLDGESKDNEYGLNPKKSFN
ncbi:MAG: DUF805 domain-containing protein [Alteromonadales bacterium]|nr:DUF805 domain-containing protein [Alteromonadales bacterium]